MKKMASLVILLMLSQILPAPGLKVFPVSGGEVINPYTCITDAVAAVESGGGINIFNEKENAVGWFGIREIRVKDYNTQTGKNITLEQCYDYQVSKTIFLYYACRFRPDQAREIARDWNKSKTEIYWNRVKVFI
jgi:hypothetical protein